MVEILLSREKMPLMCIKINWSVKTPWHRPSMRVARSGLWAPDIRLIDLVWANCHQAKRPSSETTRYLSNGLNGLCHALCYLFKKVKLVFLSIEFHKHSVADPGEGPGGPGPTLFLDQNEVRRAEKIFFWDRAPPPLSQSLDDRASPLSEGLDPRLTMVQFCYWRLYLGTEIISCRLLQRMARMDPGDGRVMVSTPWWNLLNSFFTTVRNIL